MSTQLGLDKHAETIVERLMEDVEFFKLVKNDQLRDCVRDIARHGKYDNPKLPLDEMLVSANQTRYAVTIDGSKTFLWCAFDAFLVASLLKENVIIAPCQPTSDREVTITPDMTGTTREDQEAPLSVSIPVEFTGGPLCADFCARSDFAYEQSEVKGAVWCDFAETSELAQAVLKRLN